MCPVLSLWKGLIFDAVEEMADERVEQMLLDEEIAEALEPQHSAVVN